MASPIRMKSITPAAVLPNLTTLVLKSLDDFHRNDLVDLIRRCTSLTSLSLDFAESTARRVVFKNIESLTCLHLDIGYHPDKGYFHEDEPNRSGFTTATMIQTATRMYGQLRISLKTGLDQLSELKSLRFLNVENLGNRMTMKNAEWVEQHLKRLDYVKGHMCRHSMASHRWLDAAMEMYGPEEPDFETNEAAQGICELQRKAFETNDWSILESPDGPWDYY
ncbi:hypothetical protein MVEG_12159 [Podila verticillata NRRL 6337]|uniref:F-box domain-containing protein n=1 Tax=Podila verticillata NRRL 6337 TaxID=1069443 RepID=A0A086TJ78_9FUNG|nr:hypothetical protein MVEG_12159 [Podila verticillata NRRL 6337]